MLIREVKQLLTQLVLTVLQRNALASNYAQLLRDGLLTLETGENFIFLACRIRDDGRRAFRLWLLQVYVSR